MFTSKTQCLTPFLKIYEGMKIIIIEILYPKLGIVKNIRYIENISLIGAKFEMDTERCYNASLHKCFNQFLMISLKRT